MPAGPSLAQNETDTFKIVSVIRWILSQLGPAGGSSGLTLSGGFLRGFLADPNAVSPLTKIDCSYTQCALHDAVGNTTLEINKSFTIDCGAAGPVVNGRDQAGAFSANQFLYFYTIDGASVTTGGLVSTIPPTTSTGPALPPGYSKWGFLFSARWTTNSTLIPQYVRGAVVSFQVFQDALAGGQNVGFPMVPVTLSAIVPPPAVAPNWQTLYSIIDSSGNLNTAYLGYNNTNSIFNALVSSNSGTTVIATLANVAQTIFYTWFASGSAYVRIIGYSLANGA